MLDIKKIREQQLLLIGARLAGKYGAKNVTRRMVAEEAKCAGPLVTHYMGSTEDAQRKYAKHAKQLGIAQPAKAEIERIGAELRAHGPRSHKIVRRTKDQLGRT